MANCDTLATKAALDQLRKEFEAFKTTTQTELKKKYGKGQEGQIVEAGIEAPGIFALIATGIGLKQIKASLEKQIQVVDEKANEFERQAAKKVYVDGLKTDLEDKQKKRKKK